MRLSRIKHAFFILFLCVLLLGAGSVRATSLSGSGTAEDPYLIKTAADLASMHSDLTAHYALDADIDLFGRVFEPVGNGAEGAFTGSLDGRGHTIRGLELDMPDSKYVGLFGYLEGSVTNLKLSGVDIAGGRYVGAVAGNIGVGGSVTDCSVLSGSVSSAEYKVTVCVGGITGLCEGTLDRCSNAAAVTKYGGNASVYAYVGGLAGKAAEALEISDSRNSGIVSTVYDYDAYTGGLIGQSVKKIRMQNCRNTGELQRGARTGGLLGSATDTAEIYSCSNAGRISGTGSSGDDYYRGGLIGYAEKDVMMETCTNTGDVSIACCGGIIGRCNGMATITDCVNSGTISGSYCGGIARNLSKMNLRGCRNNGYISSYYNPGGIVGVGSGSIIDCYNYGNVYGYGTGSSGYAYGILAYNSGASVVEACVNYGKITSDYANAYAIGNLTVRNCRNYGSATYFASSSGSGNLNYGDLYYKDGTKGVSLSIGSVSAYNATANITLSSGIILNGPSTVYCSDLRYADVGTGYSLAELQDPASRAYNGWSLPGNWVIPDGKNSGLPLPKDAADADLMDESVLILEKGENQTLTAPFTVRKWSSSNSIARCDGGTVTAQNVGRAVVTAYDDTGRQAKCVVFVYEKRSSLSMSETYTLTANKTVKLTTDLPDGDPQGVIWSSSNTSVASVDQNGTVSGNKPGQAVITAELPLSGVSASCTVTVQGQAVTSIKLSQTSATLPCGKTLTLTYSTGSSYDDKTVTWSSSSDTVATVEDGVVTGQTPGVAVITCQAVSGVSATCTVTVTQPSASLTLDHDALTMELGTTAQLTAQILPENTTDAIQWGTTNSSVVSVDSSGVLTAKGIGQAAVYAYTASGLKASCSVTVYAQNVWPEAVKLPQRILHARIGQQLQLEAAITPSNCNHTALTWESSNPEVASVTVTGLVQTASAGTAEIRVTTENGLYDVCTVLVSETSSAEFVVESGRVPRGGTADTAVYLVKNPGVSAFSIDVKYDAAKLEPVAVQPGALLASAGSLSSNVESIAEPGTLHVTWYSDADVADDGALFTVTWRALTADGSTAAIDLSYQEDDICNSEKHNVPVRTEAGSLLLMTCLIGDIYPDNEVNMKDIVYFARWFNELETMTAEQERAADVYFDGKLDVKDLTALAQLLCRALMTESVREMAAVSTYSAAVEPFCISVSDATVDQNGEAEIVIRGRNCPGVAALRFALDLPEGYEVLSVVPGALLSGGTFAYNEESRVVTWYASEDHVLDGELLTVRVKAGEASPENAAAGIRYLASDYFHAGSYAPVSVTVESGKLCKEVLFAVSHAERTSGAIRITVKAAAERTVRMIVADYDETGRLLGITIREQTVSAGEGSYTLPVQSANGSSSTVFIMDEARNVPLCDKTVLPG